MTMQLYTIWDTVAKDSGPIFMAKNDGTAARQYKNLLKERKLDITEDEYELIHLGEFDTESATILTSQECGFASNRKIEIPKETKNA